LETVNKINLLDLDKPAMEAFAISCGFQKFHGRNLFKWIHKHGLTDFDQMTDLSKGFREHLNKNAEVLVPKIALEHVSADGTVKWVMELADGQRIETVNIPEGDRNTVCVSSQVGCSLNCSFCSTAQQGFNRNLTVSEVIGQVWYATRFLGQTPSNVVMMGMGEPLVNFENVVAAMSIMQDDLAYMISKTKVTLSTSGIVPKIELLNSKIDVSLAVSLHSARNELRDELVPINIKYPLEQLIPACKAFIGDAKRAKITWEYVMLDGINDSVADAKALIRLLEGVPSKVNLIPFNPFPGTDYTCSPADVIERFRQRLKKSGLIATTRKTRGDDVDAACGQLVGQVVDRSRRKVVNSAPSVSVQEML